MQVCETCRDSGVGVFHVCGIKSKRGDACMQKHAAGEPASHGSWAMRSPGRRAIGAAHVERKKRKLAEQIFGEASSDDLASLEDGSSDDGVPVGSPVKQSPRLSARAKGQKAAKKAAKKAKKEKEEQEFKAREEMAARSERKAAHGARMGPGA